MATQSQVDGGLICGICLEKYQDPRIFPCKNTHTYCGKCLKNLRDKCARSQVMCPECREIVEIKDVSSLLPNRWVNDALDREMHRKDGANDLVCARHGNKHKEFFCEDCKLPLCKKCKNSDHKAHKTAKIGDITTKYRNELSNQMKNPNVRKMVEDTRSALKAVLDAKYKVDKNSREIEKQINEKINQKINDLEQARRDSLDQVKSMEGAKIQRLCNQQEQLESHLEKVKNAISASDAILQRPTQSSDVSSMAIIAEKFQEMLQTQIDTEVTTDEDGLILQTNDDYCIDIANFITVFDRNVIDRGNCKVRWSDQQRNALLLTVQNSFKEPIDIKTNRIEVVCASYPEVNGISPRKVNLPTVENFVITGEFEKPSGERDERGIHKLQVLIDGEEADWCRIKKPGGGKGSLKSRLSFKKLKSKFKRS